MVSFNLTIGMQFEQGVLSMLMPPPNKQLPAEALNKMGVIYIPGNKRQYWSVAFYLYHYDTEELRHLYNRRAQRTQSYDK